MASCHAHDVVDHSNTEYRLCLDIDVSISVAIATSCLSLLCFLIIGYIFILHLIICMSILFMIHLVPSKRIQTEKTVELIDQLISIIKESVLYTEAAAAMG